MRPLVHRILGSIAVVAAAPAGAADPVPAIAPPPAWVTAPELPSLDPTKGDMPVQFLLSTSQQKLRPDGMDQYVRYVAVPQNTVGLQALGTVALPWNAERADFVLHKVAIRRGETVIDLLKPDEITVLRRENNLEKAMLDGIRTVVIPAKGLQAGDLLDVAFSYRTKPVTVGAKPEEIQQMVAPIPIASVERRFLVPDGLAVRWNISPSIPPAETKQVNGMTEHRFVQKGAEPRTLPDYAPARFKVPIIQVSSYSDWSEVSAQLAPLYDRARMSSERSPLIGEADRIAASSPDAEMRMLAALRLAQDQIRYVALLLGEGAYTPASADETWERKFGDCKGKTALLLALLDRLGIEAEPVLVSLQQNDRLGEMLPSLFAFDHVLVRAKIGGNSYYLDATDYGQRTLDELAGSPFRHGLPIREQSALEELPPVMPAAPQREAKLVWDASKGVEGAVPFEATLVLRGSAAAEMRMRLAAATDAQEFDTGLKELVPAIRNEDLEVVETKPEATDGSFTVRFTGDAEMDWSPFEGERDTRYTLNQSTLQWKVDFDRSEGVGKDWPFFIGDSPFWQRTTETVILPNGGKGYSIDGQALDKSFAGSSASRSIRKEGDRVMMVADFRHVEREISAEEARKAEPVIEEVNEDFAYIVGPPQRKVKRRRN